MFLSTIRQRVANHGYRSADEFSSDVSKLLDSIPKASSLFKDKVTWQSTTLQPRYNAPRYSDVSVITLTHDGPQFFSTIFTIFTSVKVACMLYT